MDDLSSPNSSIMSVFDGGHSTDVMMQDEDMSPFSGSSGRPPAQTYTNHEDSTSASAAKPVALLPALESKPAASPVLAAAPANGPSTGAASGTSGTNPPGQRKRRGKRTGEKKDGDKSSAAGDNQNTTTNAAGKVIKRRAARACVSCRNRKVRCDVVETFPCGNCRWDKIECVVQEGRRRRRGLFNNRDQAPPPAVNGAAGDFSGHSHGHNHDHGHGHAHAHAHSHSVVTNGSDGSIGGFGGGFAMGASQVAHSTTSTLSQLSQLSQGDNPQAAYGAAPDFGMRLSAASQQQVRLGTAGGNPLLLPKATPNSNTNGANAPPQPASSGAGAGAGAVGSLAESPAPLILPAFPLLPVNGLLGDPHQQVSALLPGFIHPLPPRMAPEDIVYLHSKGTFTLPDETLQRALLHAYVEFVHPYMPLLELQPFLTTINARDGQNGTISLLLYHAVMFAAAAFVPAKYLKAVGFNRRREARKSFFMKARCLYDFDYESDRLTLVQALLLMTYWYETPDDQKDTWHWMGVAVSLAHTIGLHRDPRTTGEPPRRQKLRKLLWWCCFMRDRMIALGMRRPKRIRSEDADVPMLVPSDFEKSILPDDIDVIPPECRLVRDLDMQQQLAELCVEKAKLCVLVGQMLHQQYTILPRGRQARAASHSSSNGDGSGSMSITNSTMMLFPNRPVSDDGKGNGPSVVDKIDAKLRSWLLALPLSCRYAALTPSDVQNGRATIAVQRTLLHLVYHTTMSALHRPRIQPVAVGSPMLPIEQQEFSRARVRDAADCVTRMGGEMLRLRLEPYLPTAGVTVFLPAMFAHLLDIKGGVPRERRQQAVLGFITCMRIMESLRDTYAAAEIAKGFVESLLKKAGIDLAQVLSFADDSSFGFGGALAPSLGSGLGIDSSNPGTGANTPIHGTSVSLLNATSNVGVPYTEDGIAHASSMYGANTPKAVAARITPPADNHIGSSHVHSGHGASEHTNGSVHINTNIAIAISNSSSNTANDDTNMAQGNTDSPPSYLPTPVAANPMPAPSLMNGNTASNASNTATNTGIIASGNNNNNNSTMALDADIVATVVANLTAAANGTSGTGNNTNNASTDQSWGMTPSTSAISEDPFEWDGTVADPSSTKLDFDQWLDFPPEGMGSSTEHSFAGLFSANFGNDVMNTDL